MYCEIGGEFYFYWMCGFCILICFRLRGWDYLWFCKVSIEVWGVVDNSVGFLWWVWCIICVGYRGR